jgi:predicted AlkP superfamily pyrophosphatase or phosphodiesterase
MSNRLCVIDMPGLSRELLGALPRQSALGRWAASRSAVGLTPTFPAVTCSVQASLTTGASPSRHGIVANGLPTFRFAQDQALVDAANFIDYRRQVSFWEQSNQFLEASRFWLGKHKTALLFFQNSMPGFVEPRRPSAEIVLTPKPDHGTDGKLVNLCWSEPRELVQKLFGEFGPFPLMNYWGPMAGIASSQWIAKAAACVWEKMTPQLQWTYIPHLDYDLQRFGPQSPQAAKAVADAAEAVTPLVEAVLASGGQLLLLSEYAMRPVTGAVQPNRLLAEAGLLLTRSTPDGQLIDYLQSSAFAMVDHQIGHVYLRDASVIGAVRSALSGLTILEPTEIGLTHRRSGDLILLAEPSAWLDYRWWSKPADTPSFARMVDIHRKPGYDPLELFWDRAAHGVSQDSGLIHGSHGLVSRGEAVFVSDAEAADPIEATAVSQIIERLLA